MLPPVLNFVDFGAEEKKATVIVISPPNALIRDQIVKMRESGLSVCVLRGDRVDTEDGGDEEISLEVPVEMLTSAHSSSETQGQIKGARESLLRPIYIFPPV